MALNMRLREVWARHKDLVLGAAALLGVLVVLYWQAASLQGVFYVGDIYRLSYPARLEYTLGLRQGRIPLWTPYALAGFPVLAEGQTGAFYPLNLLLHGLLPVTAAINYLVLSSFWLAGVGVFLYLRALRLKPASAFAAACTLMLGGFLPGHLNHLNMLAGVAWLPLMLWATERATQTQRGWRWILLSILFAVQGLAGHPQVSLLSALLLAAYAAAAPLGEHGGPVTLKRRLIHVLLCGMAIAGGIVLAAVQWLPSFELARLSQRGQGLDAEFFTSFSLSPAHYITMLWPFIRGNPYPLTSLETIGYVGVLPLLLAALAPLRRRDILVWFWALVGVTGVLLSLGKWNPIYHWLMYVPGLNMFRAPARYLLWVDLAVAVLAGVSLDSLLELTRVGAPERQRWLPVGSLVVIGVGGLCLGQVSLERLLAAWKWLPLLWLATTSALLMALRWRPRAGLWSALCLVVLLADLGAFNAVYNHTYNATMQPAEFTRPPDALAFLEKDSDGAVYRVYTSEEILPVLSVMREALYPNIQLLYGVQSLNGYYPLMSGPLRWLANNLNPRLIDLLNVRYVLIPQLLPVDEASEAYDTRDPFAPSPVGRAFDLPNVAVAALEVEGYLSHSADLANGTPVGEVVLRDGQGHEVTWTLKAGLDISEWAYRREDVEKVVQHAMAQVVRVWPARSGFPSVDHDGLTYIARQTLEAPIEVAQLEVRPLIPAGYLHIERLRLIGPDGRSQLLSELVGEGDHVLVYRNEGVAIFRNEDAGPRAFLVHQAVVAASEAEAEHLVAAAEFRPHQQVVLLEGEALTGVADQTDQVVIEEYGAERVRMRSKSQQAGYLVLADSYYPGWKARVDGEMVPVLRADVALRAVALPAGEHVVEFSFEPPAVRWGAWLSLVALLVLGLGMVAMRLYRGVGRP